MYPVARRTVCSIVVEGAPNFVVVEGGMRHMMHGNVIDVSSHIISFIYGYAIEFTSGILCERSCSGSWMLSAACLSILLEAVTFKWILY